MINLSKFICKLLLFSVKKVTLTCMATMQFHYGKGVIIVSVPLYCNFSSPIPESLDVCSVSLQFGNETINKVINKAQAHWNFNEACYKIQTCKKKYQYIGAYRKSSDPY